MFTGGRIYKLFKFGVLLVVEHEARSCNLFATTKFTVSLVS